MEGASSNAWSSLGGHFGPEKKYSPPPNSPTCRRDPPGPSAPLPGDPVYGISIQKKTRPAPLQAPRTSPSPPSRRKKIKSIRNVQKERQFLWEEHSMDQYRSRPKLSENFEGHWSIPFSGEIHMDQSLVHTFPGEIRMDQWSWKFFKSFPLHWYWSMDGSSQDSSFQDNMRRQLDDALCLPFLDTQVSFLLSAVGPADVEPESDWRALSKESLDIAVGAIPGQTRLSLVNIPDQARIQTDRGAVWWHSSCDRLRD